MMTRLKHLDVLHIQDNEEISLGGNQDWYEEIWHQRAGCGPTNCATLLWYLAQTRPELKNLWPHAEQDKQNFLQFMDVVWDYVTPGNRGVNTTNMFTSGLEKYSRDIGLPLYCTAFEVSHRRNCRPSVEEMLLFIEDALAKDVPVAFLNLSNGALSNLDNWHWVTLVSIDRENGLCEMYDQGKSEMLDMPLWLKSSVLGGGFVTVKPQ